MKKYLTAILISIIILLTNIQGFGQKYHGPDAFRQITKYIGQDYLMEEIYNIPIGSVKFLRFSQINKHFDLGEEFILFIAAYSYDGNKGVILTSYSSIFLNNMINKSNQSSIVSSNGTKRTYRNAHLTNKEFVEVISFFNSLKLTSISLDGHIIKRINNLITIDFHKELIDISKGDVEDNIIGIYSIWIGSNKHSYSKQQLHFVFDRYNEFIES